MRNDSRNFLLAFSLWTALGFVFNTEARKIFQHFSSAAHLLRKLMQFITDKIPVTGKIHYLKDAQHSN